MTTRALNAPSTRVRTGSRLYRDALSLASSSMLTATLGIAFWGVCAKVIPPATLGVQTALLSIIVAPAIVVASGVGDAFTATIPAAGPFRLRVIARGYRMLLITSVIFGFIAGVVAVTVLPQVRGSILVALLVMAGVVVWSLFVVQDPALTSMQRAHWLPIENGSVSVLKIALIPVTIAAGIGKPVVVATLLPSVLAVAILYPQVKRLAARSLDDTAVIPLSQLAHSDLPGLVRRTTTSVALSLGTLTVTPFIVTAAAGPTQGAVFSLCLSIVQSLDFVGSALGVSLVVHASTQGTEAGRMALGVFKRTAGVVGVGAVGLIVVAPFVLRLLNASYVNLHGAAVVAILAVGSFSRTVYVIWAALQRARRNMRALLMLNTAAALFVFVTMAPFAQRWGAVGAAVVIAGAQMILSGGAAVHLLVNWRNGSPAAAGHRRKHRIDPAQASTRRARHRAEHDLHTQHAVARQLVSR